MALTVARVIQISTNLLLLRLASSGRAPGIEIATCQLATKLDPGVRLQIHLVPQSGSFNEVDINHDHLRGAWRLVLGRIGGGAEAARSRL